MNESYLKSDRALFNNRNLGIAIIVKLTNNCNLRCSYCGVSGPLVRSLIKTEYMDFSLINELFTKVLEYNDLGGVDFIWHGGEPLLMGLSFFKKIVNVQKEVFSQSKIKIKNSIQTNATLINEEWAKFFKEEKIQLGVSIDGPKEIQNKQRAATVGDSYEQTIRGIN